MRNHYILPNQIHWFKWLQCFKDDKDIIKSKNVLVHSITNFADIKLGIREDNFDRYKADIMISKGRADPKMKEFELVKAVKIAIDKAEA